MAATGIEPMNKGFADRENLYACQSKAYYVLVKFSCNFQVHRVLQKRTEEGR